MEKQIDRGVRPQAKEEPTFSPSVVDAMMKRASTSSQEGPGQLNKRGCDVPIFPEQCRPGYLTEQVWVSISELDSDEELRAYRRLGAIKSKDDGDQLEEGDEKNPVIVDEKEGMPEQALAVSLGQESIRSINGRNLTRDEKRVFWEILGMPGRLAIGTSFLAHCSGANTGFLQRSIAQVRVW